MSTTTLAPEVKVPTLAKIVEAMGGLDRLDDGESFIITEKRAIVCSDRRGDKYKLSEAAPRWGADDHTFLPLHITRFWTDEAGRIAVQVGYAYEMNGDVRYDGLYTFETTLANGTWRIVEYQNGLGSGPPLKSSYGDPRVVEELRQLAEGLDRDSIVLHHALRIAQKYKPSN